MNTEDIKKAGIRETTLKRISNRVRYGAIMSFIVGINLIIVMVFYWIHFKAGYFSLIILIPAAISILIGLRQLKRGKSIKERNFF